MSRYSVVSGTGIVVGANSTVDVELTVSSNNLNVYKVAVAVNQAGSSELFVHKATARASGDKVYFAMFSGVAFFDPIDRGEAETNEGFIFPYEDKDATTKLHIRIVNLALASRTFTVTITYDTPIVNLTEFLANPTTDVGLTIANGSASTAMRSDGAPALSQSIAPTWTGNHLFKPGTNSTTAFEVQDKDGNIVLDVDTTNRRVGVGLNNPVSALEIAGSTSNSSIKAGTFEIQSYAVNNAWSGANSYYDGAGFRYRANGYVILAYFSGGDFLVRTAPSGSAGAPVTLTNRLVVRNAGNVGIGTGDNSVTSILQVVGLPVYANNAAAVAGGLTAGAFYRTGADPDPVCVVH